MTQPSLPKRFLLPMALVAMCVLSVAPIRTTRWVSWFGGLTSVAIAPVRHPAGDLARYLQRSHLRDADPEVVRVLKNERDQLIATVEQLGAQNTDLTRMLGEFTTGDLLAPRNPPTRQYAPVTGRSTNAASTILTAQAGSNKGVNEGCVAVVGGAQIVGRVVAVSILECQIRPITDTGSGWISGVILISDGSYVKCRLEPKGDGTLVGPVMVDDPASVMGAIVRLKDMSWPTFVQRYEIGRVESASPNEEHPLTIFVTVRPKVRDLSLTSEVFILLPTEGRR